MQGNAVKMHAGLVLFLLLLIPHVRGELQLIVSEFVDGNVGHQVDDVVELPLGSNFYLVCMIGGPGSFSNPRLVWARKTKDLWFRNENDLIQMAKNNSALLNDLQEPNSHVNRYYYRYESNKAVRRFEPVRQADAGVHFCMSLKYYLFKIVHVKINEDLDVIRSCSANMFRCTISGYCINLHYKCDGKNDCPDGSDEDHLLCNGNPCWNKIPCTNGRCIPRSWCCDKHVDDECNVNIRPKCCPPLKNPYDPLIWHTRNASVPEVGKGSGSKYLFITICVVSALLSFVLFLFIISKICGFDAKPRRGDPTACTNSCDHSECVLRRQFSADVTCLYRRDVNVNDGSENNNELADPLILINGRITDQPPSYSEVINSPVTITKSNLDELIDAPPPPYSSTNAETESDESNPTL